MRRTAIAAGVARGWPDATTVLRPMADGGEGTLDAVLRAAGERGTRGEMAVEGAGGREIKAGYGIVDRDGVPIAVLEAAQVVAITDRDGHGGAGERTVDASGSAAQLRELLDRGVRDVMIGLGGSSTNDGGAGLLAALGLRLLDAHGRNVAPTPDGLAALASVDASALDPRSKACAITIMSDVNNPLAGDARRHRDLRAAEGRRARAHRRDRRDARTLRGDRRGRARPACGDESRRGRRGRARPRADARRRHDALGRRGRRRPDRARCGARRARPGRSPAKGAAMRRRCSRRGRRSSPPARAAKRVPVSLLSGAIDAAALPALQRALRRLLRAARGAGNARRVRARRRGVAGRSRAEAMARLVRRRASP